jgi:hypothetical protein
VLSAPQLPQDVLCSLRLAQFCKDILHAMPVRIGIHIRHRIHHQHHVIAQIVGAPRCETSCISETYFVCFSANRTLIMRLIAAMPAKKTPSATSPAFATLPARNST